MVVSNKPFTFAPAFENEAIKFFDILINNKSSTIKKIEPSISSFIGIINEFNNKEYGILNRAKRISFGYHKILLQ